LTFGKDAGLFRLRLAARSRGPVSNDDEIRAAASAALEEFWRLLEKPDRSRDEGRALIAAAHANLSGWEKIGTFVEQQRGNWLVARAYIELGLVEPALIYARKTMEITAAHHQDLADFDRAFAKELAARAWALAGNIVRAKAHHADAHMLGEAIGNDADRREFFRQFERGPWFRLNETEPDEG
jgi:hypothetical protein